MQKAYKKGFYFSQIDEKGFGPRRKVNSQIRLMKDEGIDLTLVENPFRLHGRIRGNFILRQIVCRLPFTYVYSKHKYEARFTGADVFYIRFLAGDRAFVRFLKQLRQNNPNAKILLELADYPTTWYMTVSVPYTLLYLPIIIKDLLARRHYKKYVDRIVVPQPRKEIFGIPAIEIKNGIAVKEIRPRRPQKTEVIRLLAVAGMCNFHGYDRMIEGLRAYYAQGGNRKIELHLVGGKEAPGNDLTLYKELCKRYRLEACIKFYGEKTGEALDRIYDQCNLAVGSLGMYRIGYQTANSLKISEYLSKGLPVIVGSRVDVLEKEAFPYALTFPNDATPIDIGKVIEFYDKIYLAEDVEAVNESIRKYAERNCDMKQAFGTVISYIQDSC